MLYPQPGRQPRTAGARSLQGFKRVTLQPGETKQVSFDLGFPELSFYNNAEDRPSSTRSLHSVDWRQFRGQRSVDFDIVP